MHPTTIGLIEETKNLWNTGKKVMIQVASNLSQIKSSNEWQSYGYTEFPKFAEEILEIKASQTSKLLAIAEYYLKEFSPDQIGPTDYEALYMATRLPGTVAENLAKAQTLKRSELRAEKEEASPCEHEIKPCCVKCWAVQPS